MSKKLKVLNFLGKVWHDCHTFFSQKYFWHRLADIDTPWRASNEKAPGGQEEGEDADMMEEKLT